MTVLRARALDAQGAPVQGRTATLEPFTGNRYRSSYDGPRAARGLMATSGADGWMSWTLPPLQRKPGPKGALWLITGLEAQPVVVATLPTDDTVTLDQRRRGTVDTEGDLVAPTAVGTSGYDLVILLGQSNMQGQNGGSDARTDPPDSRVFSYDYGGPYHDMIAGALDPLNHQGGASGVGPGMSFARWYARTQPVDRAVLLVPAAASGTHLVPTDLPTWNPGIRDSLYDHAVTHARAALTAAGPNARIIAALWAQGESDSDAGISQADYAAALDALIAGLRAELAVPTLPFLIGGMVPEAIATRPYGRMAAAHADTPNRVPFTAYAPGTPGYDGGDNLHYAAAGQRVQGRALAAALSAAKANTRPTPPPPPSPSPPPTPPPPSDGTDTGPALTPLRGTATYVAGKFGQALTGGALAVAGTVAVGDGGTIEAWVRTSAEALSVALGNPNGAPSWWLGADSARGGVFIASLTADHTSNVRIIDGQWHHCAATFSSAGLTLWVDGQQAGTYADVPIPSLRFGTAAEPLAIGGYGTVDGFDWAGEIDEVRISSVIRYTANFTPPIGPFTPDASTVALYHLDGGAAATTVADTFDRADSTTTLGSTSTGSALWRAVAGTWGISGGKAYNAGGTSGALAAVDMGSADHRVEARVTASDTGSGLIARLTDASNWLMVLAPAGAELQVYRNVGGTTSAVAYTGTPVAAGDVVGLSCSGGTITYSVNGTPAGTFTDSSTGTLCGFRADSNAARFDDFAATTLDG